MELIDRLRRRVLLRWRTFSSPVDALEAAGLDPSTVEITSIDGGPVVTIDAPGPVYSWTNDGRGWVRLDADGTETEIRPQVPSGEAQSSLEAVHRLMGPEYGLSVRDAEFGVSVHELLGEDVRVEDVRREIDKLAPRRYTSPRSSHVVPDEVREFCQAEPPWWWGSIGSRKRGRRRRVD